MSARRDESQDEEMAPFVLGYAYEALARAASVAGNADQKKDWLDKANEVAERMSDEEMKKLLE